MRRSRSLAAAVALASAAAFTFLEAPAPVRGGPPPPRAWRSDCRGKPGAPLGTLAAGVLERPYMDTAVVLVEWQRGAAGDGCHLELVLPAGATLEEGEADQALPEGLDAGACSFRVRYALDRTSDLTLRLCAHVEGCQVMREAYVRLWEVPEASGE